MKRDATRVGQGVARARWKTWLKRFAMLVLGIALAVRDMHLTTREAVWAATAGGAKALRRDDVGLVTVGARADLIMLDAPSHAYLAYRPGVPQISAVWQSGLVVTDR